MIETRRPSFWFCCPHAVLALRLAVSFSAQSAGVSSMTQGPSRTVLRDPPGLPSISITSLVFLLHPHAWMPWASECPQESQSRQLDSLPAEASVIYQFLSRLQRKRGITKTHKRTDRTRIKCKPKHLWVGCTVQDFESQKPSFQEQKGYQLKTLPSYRLGYSSWETWTRQKFCRYRERERQRERGERQREGERG